MPVARPLLLLAGLALALALPARVAGARELLPPPPGYVLDEVGWLSVSERHALNERLARHERESSVQIVVALIEALDGEEPADFSARLAEHWGIGQAGEDNGVLVAAYAEDRQLRIEVGYGLEGAIPDAVASRIVRDTLAPAFRAGRHAEGLAVAADQLIAASRGEFTGSGRTQAERGDPRLPLLFVLVVVLFMVAFFILVARLGAGRTFATGHPSRQGSSGWGSFGGGGGGGGFSGFSGGGGSFGGGGAGGSW